MKLVPDGKEMGTKALENPKYLDNKLIAQPAAALQLVAKEVMYCAKLVDEMIGKLQYGNGKIDKENAELVEENAKYCRSCMLRSMIILHHCIPEVC